VGDALASRMALASKREIMSNLMPLLKDYLTLLRARLPCLRITRVTFCTLPVIPSIRLGEFILGSLTLVLIMLLCIRVRHLVLGNQLSHPVLEGKPNVNHVRARISNSRTQQLHNMDIITQCSNSILKKGNSSRLHHMSETST
jgi:hypothetical protein